MIGFGLRPGCTGVLRLDLEASARQEMRPELIASLVFAESSFRKAVQSCWRHRPDRFGHIPFCGHNDLYDPEQNVYCGTQILALLERCEGDHMCAIAYNIGLNLTAARRDRVTWPKGPAPRTAEYLNVLIASPDSGKRLLPNYWKVWTLAC